MKQERKKMKSSLRYDDLIASINLWRNVMET